MGLEEQVLKRVVPSPEEEARIQQTVEEVKARVSAGIRARGLDAEPLLVGSVAQRDQVRLLKAFCDGVGVYGAEAKVQGFSGYLCELLVLRYGTFRGVLEAASRWRRGEVIELDTRPARSFPEPLVLIDPIDAERNVASAVGEESLGTFLHAAKAFLKRPRVEFFFPRGRRTFTAAQARATLRRRGTTLLGIVLPAPRITEDILYPQIRKAQRAIEDLCRKADFRIVHSRSGLAGNS